MKENKTTITFGCKDAGKGVELIIPYGMELFVQDGKVVIIDKNHKYPKTYEECCDVLKIEYPYFKTEEDGISASTYKNALIGKFKMLLICRDAYWKIAGEQMELGKPWEPDWSIYEHKFCLGTDKDKVIEECVTTGNRILAFPTKEMRDAFYENFKELIESCKELL